MWMLFLCTAHDQGPSNPLVLLSPPFCKWHLLLPLTPAPQMLLIYQFWLRHIWHPLSTPAAELCFRLPRTLSRKCCLSWELKNPSASPPNWFSFSAKGKGRSSMWPLPAPQSKHCGMFTKLPRRHPVHVTDARKRVPRPRSGEKSVWVWKLCLLGFYDFFPVIVPGDVRVATACYLWPIIPAKPKQQKA